MTEDLRVNVEDTSRTWRVKLKVEDAPITARRYSPHWIEPRQVVVTYLAFNGGVPVMNTVHLIGVNARQRGMGMQETWHAAEDMPAWLLELAQRFRPVPSQASGG